MTVYRAWYVAESDLLTTAHPDFPERFPIREGETLTLPASVIPKVCEAGYHASPRLLDALGYRPEGMITLVEVSGSVSVGSDKIAGRSRKTLRIVPKAIADRECRLFAADVAERLLLAERASGREPAAASWTAVEIARRFARGDASKDELAEAEEEAEAEAGATWTAVRAAVRAARAAEAAKAVEAEGAARAATRAAAWAAARAAARAADWATAWAAEAAAIRAAEEVRTSEVEVRAVEVEALSTDLEARIFKAIGERQ